MIRTGRLQARGQRVDPAVIAAGPDAVQSHPGTVGGLHAAWQFCEGSQVFVSVNRRHLIDRRFDSGIEFRLLDVIRLRVRNRQHEHC